MDDLTVRDVFCLYRAILQRGYRYKMVAGEVYVCVHDYCRLSAWDGCLNDYVVEVGDG